MPTSPATPAARSDIATPADVGPDVDAPTGVLRVTGVTQRFGERTVLDDVDLVVPPGRVVGLLGPNGAGKTTLMRIIFGVIDPDRGSVLLGDREVGADERRSWGYLPQERGLYDEMRVGDLVAWFARLHGLPRDDARRRADDLLERLGLGDRRRDAVRDLSGGMAQRVQLAAAMVHGPTVLVLDEPFAGLDPVAVRFLTDVVLDHVRGGGHLLLSSHQLDLVEDLCETISLIHQGRVVLQGDVAELKAASPDRYLRVDVPVDPAWVANQPASIGERSPAGTRLRLEPGADLAALLAAVHRHRPVRDFAVEAPTLGELFLAATGDPADPGAPGGVPADAAGGAGGGDAVAGASGDDADVARGLVDGGVERPDDQVVDLRERPSAVAPGTTTGRHP